MLPNTNSHLRTEPGTFRSDVDIAEMFLNFFLDWHLRKYAGVDLTSYFTDDLGKEKIPSGSDGIVLPWGSGLILSVQFI
jgi:hypothetical protein